MAKKKAKKKAAKKKTTKKKAAKKKKKQRNRLAAGEGPVGGRPNHFAKGREVASHRD